MPKRFGTFGTRKRNPIIQDLTKYIDRVAENPQSFNPAVFIGFKTQLLVFFNDKSESSINLRNIENFTDKRLPIPAIFEALLERFQNIWKQQLDRAFATALNSLTGVGRTRNATRLTLVTNILRALIGKSRITVENQRALGIVRLTRRFNRVFKQPLDSYLQMLLNTVPRNLLREYEEIRGNLIVEEEVLFRVTPNPIPESADTCVFVSNQVLTPAALKLVTSRLVLRTPLFHPNCFLPDTSVLTVKGVMPICNIYRGVSVDLGIGVFKPVISTLKREYIGETISVKNRGSEVFSTPDHFYLTHRGWIAAQELRVTDNLVNGSLAELPIEINSSVFESKNEVALLIEECISTAISLHSRTVSVGSTVNLNVQSVQNEVKYPPPNRELSVEFRESFVESEFVGIEFEFEYFAISLRSLLLDTFSVSIASVIYEVLLSRASRQAKLNHELFNTGRTFESHKGSYSFGRKILFIIDPFQKGFDFARTLTRKWSNPDNITHSYYSGSVYDLEVKDSSCYIVNDTFVHNCRHQIRAITRDKFKGNVIDVGDVRRAVRSGKIKLRKR